MVFTLQNEITSLFYLLQYSQSGLVRYYAKNQCRQCPTLPLIFSFLQFDFVISLRDAKEILDTILTYVRQRNSRHDFNLCSDTRLLS